MAPERILPRDRAESDGAALWASMNSSSSSPPCCTASEAEALALLLGARPTLDTTAQAVLFPADPLRLPEVPRVWLDDDKSAVFELPLYKFPPLNASLGDEFCDMAATNTTRTKWL